MTTLLADIERFIGRHSLAPTAFGALFGDRHFVRQLRAGRWVRPTTEAKVRRAMEKFEAEHAELASSDRSAPETGNLSEMSGLPVGSAVTGGQG